VRSAGLACSLLAALGVLGCGGGAPRLQIHKRTLVLLPLPWRRPSIHVADDGEHVTFAVRTSGGYYAMTPRGREETYADLGPPLFAPGSNRVYYWALDQRDGKKHIVLVADGTAIPTDFAETGSFVHAPGGTRWAALGWLDTGFDAEGKSTGTNAEVIVDGHEAGRAAAMSRPTFSPDGAHVAWLARDERGTTTLVVDGTVTRTFETSAPPDPGAPRFDNLGWVGYLSDGRLLVLAPEGAGWAMFRGDERLASYGQSIIPGSTLFIGGQDTPANVVASSIVTAEHAPVAVWWEHMPGPEERWRVVRDGAAVDGMVCSSYWDTQPPVPSADGAHLAYVCPTPQEPSIPLGRRYVMLDGRRFGPYIETWTLGLAADGSRVAYGASEALPVRHWRVFANGMPVSGVKDLVWRPRLSPDGAHVFWAGGPDPGRGTIAVDSRLVTRFDDLLYGPEFQTPGVATWVIRRGRKISRLDVRY
jgi:hypothetical protein